VLHIEPQNRTVVKISNL